MPNITQFDRHKKALLKKNKGGHTKCGLSSEVEWCKRFDSSFNTLSYLFI